MVLHISPKYMFAFFLIVSFTLVALHVAGQTARLEFGHGRLHGLVPLFDLEEEDNIPSLWSSIQWLSAGSIACFIAYHARVTRHPDWLHWSGMSALFYLFGIDETAQIHERIGGLVTRVLRFEGMRPTGAFYYAWTIPAIVFALAVFIVYSRFLLRLPRGVLLLFLIAGAVFVTGAVGFELLEGPIDEAGGYKNLLYTVYVTCEESFEMAGVCILILGLLRFVSVVSPTLQVAISDTLPSSR